MEINFSTLSLKFSIKYLDTEFHLLFISASQNQCLIANRTDQCARTVVNCKNMQHIKTHYGSTILKKKKSNSATMEEIL